MPVRESYEIADVQQAITALLRDRITNAGSPWTSWTVVEGYPDQSVFENFDSSFFYTHTPQLIEQVFQSGGGKPMFRWEIIVGGWTDRQKGGSEEAGIMLSHLLRLFSGSAVNTIQFSGTVGGTAFTNSTLPELGITIESAGNPRRIEYREEDDFRGEIAVTLQA